jgi:L-fuconolactonase
VKADLNRREFVGALATLPFVVEATLASQTTAPIPTIDTHIHLFDKSRPEGSPYPSETSLLGKTFQSALPTLFREVARPFGVVGAIVIESQVSPRVVDDQWVLDTAAKDPFIVGTVGRLDPRSPTFGKNIERFHKNELFLGIRPRQLFLVLEKPEFASSLKLLADAALSLDGVLEKRDDDAMVLVRITDLVPSLRIVINHYPSAKLPDDRAAREAYLISLKELGKRPQVYIKLSDVVRKVGEKVSVDLSIYKDWLDQLWDIFGEDRLLFGSNWPQSENLELNSYPNIMSVAREYVSGKGREVMEKVFWKNSIPAYRWIRRDSTQPGA